MDYLSPTIQDVRLTIVLTVQQSKLEMNKQYREIHIKNECNQNLVSNT